MTSHQGRTNLQGRPASTFLSIGTTDRPGQGPGMTPWELPGRILEIWSSPGTEMSNQALSGVSFLMGFILSSETLVITSVMLKQTRLGSAYA